MMVRLGTLEVEVNVEPGMGWDSFWDYIQSLPEPVNVTAWVLTRRADLSGTAGVIKGVALTAEDARAWVESADKGWIHEIQEVPVIQRAQG